jgi:hypothetical protein
MQNKVIIEIIYLYLQIWPPLADNFGDHRGAREAGMSL